MRSGELKLNDILEAEKLLEQDGDEGHPYLLVAPCSKDEFIERILRSWPDWMIQELIDSADTPPTPGPER